MHNGRCKEHSGFDCPSRDRPNFHWGTIRRASKFLDSVVRNAQEFSLQVSNFHVAYTAVRCHLGAQNSVKMSVRCAENAEIFLYA